MGLLAGWQVPMLESREPLAEVLPAEGTPFRRKGSTPRDMREGESRDIQVVKKGGWHQSQRYPKDEPERQAPVIVNLTGDGTGAD
jgi:hypothetical protein